LHYKIIQGVFYYCKTENTRSFQYIHYRLSRSEINRSTIDVFCDIHNCDIHNREMICSTKMYIYNSFLRYLDHPGLTLDMARRGCRKIEKGNERAELSGHSACSARSAKSNYSRECMEQGA